MQFHPARSGVYRQVPLSQVEEFLRMGWMEIGSPGSYRDIYTVLMWHCDCEVKDGSAHPPDKRRPR
jgi:hypothetical protein